MQPKTVMSLAFLLANESKCVSMKVGAVIYRGNTILSTGINGTPPNAQNCCDVMVEKGYAVEKMDNSNYKVLLKENCSHKHSEWSSLHEIHAEMNAIMQADPSKLHGSTICITHSPCVRCASLIASTGIKKVVYCITYWRNNGDREWADILENAGIEVLTYPLSDIVSLLNISIEEKCEYENIANA